MRECNGGGVYLMLYQDGYELLPVRQHPRTMLRTGPQKFVNLGILKCFCLCFLRLHRQISLFYIYNIIRSKCFVYSIINTSIYIYIRHFTNLFLILLIYSPFYSFIRHFTNLFVILPIYSSFY